MVGGGYLPDRLNWATADWVYRLNNMENHQWFGLGLGQFIAIILGAPGK
jgi:hypothetical protein